MKRLIYYPGFESTNENWLKFALLYIDKLSPILPVRADSKSSDLYRKISNETDLLAVHRPAFLEGEFASLSVIDIVNKVAVDPYSYEVLFDSKPDIVRLWKDPSNHTYTLYEEKYSSFFQRFCIEKGYGTPIDDGIKLSESLAVLYMTVLANIIADNKHISPITDYPKLDKLSFFLKQNAPLVTNESVNAKAIINLKLPTKLQNLNFDEVFKLRNSKGFKQSQAAFHDELTIFLGKLETGNHADEFVRKFEKEAGSFTEQFLSFGNDLFSFGLGTYVLLDSANPHLPEILKLIGTVAGISIKQGYSINKAWKNSASNRHCRRYLAALETLS